MHLLPRSLYPRRGLLIHVAFFRSGKQLLNMHLLPRSLYPRRGLLIHVASIQSGKQLLNMHLHYRFVSPAKRVNYPCRFSPVWQTTPEYAPAPTLFNTPQSGLTIHVASLRSGKQLLNMHLLPRSLIPPGGN